jgi:hypothetical protein
VMKPGITCVCFERTVTRASGPRSGHTKTVDIQRKGAERPLASITELKAIVRFVMRLVRFRARSADRHGRSRVSGFWLFQTS